MSDQLQPEPRPPETQSPLSLLAGPVLVKRDFGFWHPATLHHYSGLGATVSFNDEEELTLPPSLVQPLRLKKGELVFLRVEQLFGGDPCRLLALEGQHVELEMLDFEYGDRLGSSAHWLREIRVYRDLRPVAWKKGDRVVAYLPLMLTLPLFFSGVVHAVHEQVCVEIDFDNGQQAVVPTTLIQRVRVQPGDFVFARGEESMNGTHYYPCAILERDGDALLLQDGSGESFPYQLDSVGVLPRGYRWAGDLWEKVPGECELEEPGPDEVAPEGAGPEEGVLPAGKVTPPKQPWWRFWG